MPLLTRIVLRELARILACATSVGLLLTGLAGTILGQTAASGAAPPVLLDNMDSGAPVLRLLNASDVKLVDQSVEHGSGQFGSPSERLVMSIQAGASAQVGYPIPPARVLDELRVSAWIACNRPGVQMAATVVLPRSADPETGKPHELLLRSGQTAPGGGWQEISLGDMRSHLADQARVLRASRGGEIDEREAYVSQLVIMAPGGPGVTELVVDQISVHGVFAGADAPTDASELRTTIIPAAAQSPAMINTPPAERPAVPRIIQWQGEPLEMLQRLGFDAAWMGRLPTDEELAELRRLGMFAVCPPPAPHQLQASGLGPEYSHVLAWDLGQLSNASDVDLAHRWAQSLEMHESDASRPVLLEPFGMAREASRVADVVMLGRPVIGSAQSWTDYAAWLNLQRRLALPGTPIWVNVETHCSTRFMAQLAALRGDGQLTAVPATLEELSRATTASLGLMPRGFCFQSQASLAGADVETRLRALALELTNLRLGLVEPWLAGGRRATAARSTRPNLSGLVLKVERSHLIIPLRWDDRPAAAEDETRPIAFDLPGVPESCDAYLVSVSGSQRLPGRRVTGGLRVSIEQLPDDAFVLVTEDGYAYSHVERYLRKHAPRAAQLRVELAALRRQQAAKAMERLPPAAIEAGMVREQLRLVDAQMTAVVDAMRRHDHAAAFACAAEAERLLNLAHREIAAAVAPTLPAGASPLPIDWSTLADLAAVAQTASQAQAPWQLIPGGEFEVLEELLSSGWQRMEKPPEGLEAVVRLSPEAPARGGYCLELEVTSPAPPGNPPMLPKPPVWVTSPPLRPPAGHMVEIAGMARVREAPLGSPDPLLIFDSIGGEESAVRISSAPSWTPFRIVRAPAANSEVRLTIALGGVGRVQVDSLAYRFIPMPRDAIVRSQARAR